MAGVPRVDDSGLTVRFDQAAHAYYLGGVRVPSVTQMLTAEGLIDLTWFTEESRRRGTAVHELTQSYDLGAVDVDEYEGEWRGYLLAHVEAMRVLKPAVEHVEVPWIHRRYRFGCRIDRVWKLFGAGTIAELKSGPREKWHQIQTALQAIVYEQESGVPAHSLQRGGLHLKPDGRFKWEPHDNPTDFGKAKNILNKWACRLEPWVPVEPW